MNLPDKCPKCESDKRAIWRVGVEFSCGSFIAFANQSFHETADCLSGQRDQLAARVADADRERDHANDTANALLKEASTLRARVKELEPYEAICKNPAALWANWLRGTVVLPAGIGDVRQEQARVKELEAERDQLLVEVEKIKEERNRASMETRNELIPKLQKLKDENAALKQWIADLNEIGRHSGKSEHREWNGEIGWLLHGQVAYVGEEKP